jgi:phage-related protein
MAGKSASISIRILGDESGFSRALKTTETKLAGFSSKMEATGAKMRNVGQSMSLGMTLPIVGALGLGVKWAGELEDAQAATEQVFGSMSATMDRWADGAAKAFGLSKGEALEWSNQIGIRLTEIGGLSDEAAAKQAQNLTQLAGDMASFFGGTTADAATAINSALTGEFEPLKRYGVIINDTSLKAELLALTGEKVTGTLTGQQKQMATLSLITKGTTKVQGDYARNADGATNAQRTMTASLKDAATGLGTILLPYITKAVQFLTALVDKFQALSGPVQRVIVVVALLAAALGPVIYIAGAVATAIGFIASPVGLVVAAIAALIAGLVMLYRGNDGFRAWIDNVASILRDKLLGAFNLIAGGVRAFAAAWSANDGDVTSSGFPGFMERLANQLRDIADVVIPALGRAWAWITGTALPAIRPVVADAIEMFAALANRVSTTASWIVDNIDEAVQIVAAVFRWLEPVIRVVWTAISAQVRAAITFVRGVIQTVTALLRGDWSAVWEGIRTILAGVWQGILGIVSAAVGFLRLIVSGALSAIAAVFSGVWNGIRSATSAAFGAVAGVISGAMSSARGAVSSAIDGIGSLFRGVRSTVSSALSGLADVVSAPFRAAGSAIKSAWNSTIGGKGITIPDIPGLPGRGKRYEIPRLHTGGTFRAPGDVEGLALLKNGETVRTRQQEAALRASSSSSSPSVVVHLEGAVIAGRDAERWLVETIETAVARGIQMPKLKTALR